MAKWLPNIPDETPAENSDNSSDFSSSWEGHGRKFSLNWPVIAAVSVALLLGCVLFASHAFAAPPQIGEVHEFTDPLFGGDVVLCDTQDEIASIALASVPNDTFQGLRASRNDRGDPTCVALPFMAMVTSVQTVGVMHFSGHAFHAWSVGVTGKSGIPFFALYLELFNEVNTWTRRAQLPLALVKPTLLDSAFLPALPPPPGRLFYTKPSALV